MLKKRLLTTAILVGILIGVVLISHKAPVLFFLVGTLFVFTGMREFLRMSGGIRGVGSVGGVLVFSLIFITAVGARPGAITPAYRIPIDPEWTTAAIFAVLIGLFLFQISRRDGSNALLRISTTMTGIIYVAWLFGFLPRINYYKYSLPGYDGRWYIFFLFLVVKTNDSLAYLIGSKWGQHMLMPRVSPRKTIEGAVGGVLGAGLAAIVGKFVFALDRITWPAALTLGMVLGGAAVMGDLAESLLKRSSDRKDSGRTLPGMGGILDLFDSIFFTAPLLYLYMKLILKL